MVMKFIDPCPPAVSLQVSLSGAQPLLGSTVLELSPRPQTMLYSGTEQTLLSGLLCHNVVSCHGSEHIECWAQH